METATKPRRNRNTFLITGEFITDHCRDRVFDFEWEDGLRFLSSSVPEITYAQSIEILSPILRRV